MSRYSDDLDQYGPDRRIFGFGLKWFLAVAAFVAIASLILGLLGFVFGWFGAGVKIVSPENVTEQFRAAYDDINALDAVAANICIAVKQRNLYPVGSDGYNTGESNVVAQEQNYQRIEKHYNAYIHDPFRAKLVRPRDLPDPAPTEGQSLAALPGGGCKP